MYLFFFEFFPYLGHYKILSQVPCAIQQALVVYLFKYVAVLVAQSCPTA